MKKTEQLKEFATCKICNKTFNILDLEEVLEHAHEAKFTLRAKAKRHSFPAKLLRLKDFQLN